MLILRFISTALLCCALIGCTDDPFEGTRAESTSDLWLKEVGRTVADADNLTVDSLGTAIKELGAAETLTLSANGEYYTAVLENVKGDDLPCGSADITIIVILDSSGEVDTYGIGPRAVCIATDWKEPE